MTRIAAASAALGVACIAFGADEQPLLANAVTLKHTHRTDVVSVARWSQRANAKNSSVKRKPLVVHAAAASAKNRNQTGRTRRGLFKFESSARAPSADLADLDETAIKAHNHTPQEHSNTDTARSSDSGSESGKPGSVHDDADGKFVEALEPTGTLTLLDPAPTWLENAANLLLTTKERLGVWHDFVRPLRGAAAGSKGAVDETIPAPEYVDQLDAVWSIVPRYYDAQNDAELQAIIDRNVAYEQGTESPSSRSSWTQPRALYKLAARAWNSIKGRVPEDKLAVPEDEHVAERDAHENAMASLQAQTERLREINALQESEAFVGDIFANAVADAEAPAVVDNVIAEATAAASREESASRAAHDVDEDVFDSYSHVALASPATDAFDVLMARASSQSAGPTHTVPVNHDDDFEELRIGRERQEVDTYTAQIIGQDLIAAGLTAYKQAEFPFPEGKVEPGMLIEVHGLTKTHKELNGQQCTLIRLLKGSIIAEVDTSSWKAYCATAERENKIFKLREKNMSYIAGTKSFPKGKQGGDMQVLVTKTDATNKEAQDQVCKLGRHNDAGWPHYGKWEVTCDKITGTMIVGGSLFGKTEVKKNQYFRVSEQDMVPLYR